MLSQPMRAKQLELLKAILPRLKKVAFLRHPDIALDVKEVETTATSLGLEPVFVEARTTDEIRGALSSVTRQQAGALSVLAGTLFFRHRTLIADMAIKSRLPTVYLLREHAEAGGLLTYGVDLRDSFWRAAVYVDKILKGAKPGDLPVEQPTKFELVINLRTARALGITIPGAVLVRADRTIE